jgi:hypothetical protein
VVDEDEERERENSCVIGEVKKLIICKEWKKE